MSLQSHKHKKYVRKKKDLVKHQNNWEYEYEDLFDEDALWYDDYFSPTMSDIVHGYLFRLLMKLKLKSAKEMYDTWYW